MDLTGGLRRLGPLADRPGTALILTVGQEGNQAQQVIRAPDQAVQTGLLNAQLLKEHGAVFLVKLRNVLLQLGADGQHLCALFFGPLCHQLKVAVAALVGKAVLIHIGGINDGLEAQQIGGGNQRHILVAAGKGAGGLAGIEMLGQRLEHLDLAQELLVALGGLGGLFHTAIHHFKVCHHQLQIDALHVTQRIHRHIGAGIGHHMHDVLIVKAAHHMDNGIGAADILQKLVAQTRTLRGALHQAGNVHKLNDGGGLFLRLIHLRQLVQPLVRHGHYAHIGLDGAKRIVGALSAGIGNGVEQSGLAHIGQADDT